MDGTVAGDEWKAYAQSTDRVWYYAALNGDDEINVDFVTGCGPLSGHHVITHRTSGQFDIGVRLDFDNTRNPSRSFSVPLDTGEPGLIGSRDVQPILSNHAQFTLSPDGGQPIPVTVQRDGNNRSIDDLVDDINKALETAGLSDQVIARRVSSDAQVGSTNGTRIGLFSTDHVRALNPLATLVISDTNAVAQNDLGLTNNQQATFVKAGIADFNRLLPSEEDLLAITVDGLGGDDTVTVGDTVVKTVWVDGGRGNDKIKFLPGKLLIDRADSESCSSNLRNDDRNHAYSLGTIDQSRLFIGLTIDTEPSRQDVDWYKFRLATQGMAGDAVTLTSRSPDADQVTFELKVPVCGGQPEVSRLADAAKRISLNSSTVNRKVSRFGHVVDKAWKSRHGEPL